MSALRELLASFRIEVDEHALHEAHEHVEGFRKTLKEVGNVLAEAFAIEEIKEFVEHQIEAGAQLGVMANRLGTTTDELQAMQLAAGEAGVGVESLTTGLRFLNRNISEASSGGGAAAGIFRDLGIELKGADGKTRAAAELMGDLADKIAATPEAAKKTELAMKLLGRGGAELIPLLNRGGKAFEEARVSMEELGGGMSGEFVEQAHEAEAANVRLEFAMKGLKSQVASALFPAFGEMVKWLTELAKSAIVLNKETNILTTALAFFGTIGAVKALGSLRDLAKVFGLLKPTIGETVLSLLGFAAPLLVIGLLYLLFDDLYTLMTGGESVIGDTLDELFGLGTARDFAKDLGETLWATLDILEDVGANIWNLIVTPFEAAWDIVKGLAAQLNALAHGDFAGVAKAADKMGKELGTDLSKRAGKNSQTLDELGDDFTLSRKGRQDKRQAREWAQRGAAQPGFGVLAPAGSPTNMVERFPARLSIYGHPLGPMAAGGGAGAKEGVVVHQNNQTHVEVHTSSDQPEAVGQATGQGVSTSQQRNAERAIRAGHKP